VTEEEPARQGRARKQVLLRLDLAVHDALATWAAGELRSTNAQIEYLLRRALADTGRLPSAARPIPRRGRPPNPDPPAAPPDAASDAPPSAAQAPQPAPDAPPGAADPPASLHLPPQAADVPEAPPDEPTVTSG
jgi:hypothetical protein